MSTVEAGMRRVVDALPPWLVQGEWQMFALEWVLLPVQQSLKGALHDGCVVASLLQ
jgi:hypothetical protein